MKGRTLGQVDFGGYRFQLAYMAYALALTHLHRPPAAPGQFKTTPYNRLWRRSILWQRFYQYYQVNWERCLECRSCGILPRCTSQLKCHSAPDSTTMVVRRS